VSDHDRIQTFYTNNVYKLNMCILKFKLQTWCIKLYTNNKKIVPHFIGTDVNYSCVMKVVQATNGPL